MKLLFPALFSLAAAAEIDTSGVFVHLFEVSFGAPGTLDSFQFSSPPQIGRYQY